MVRKEEGPRRWGGRDRAGAATAPMRPQACQQSATNPVGTSDRRRGVGRGRAMMDTTCLGEDGAERCSTGGRPCEQRRAHSPLTAFEEGRWPAGGSCSSDEITKGSSSNHPTCCGLPHQGCSSLLSTTPHHHAQSGRVRGGDGERLGNVQRGVRRGGPRSRKVSACRQEPSRFDTVRTATTPTPHELLLFFL